jgi:hypothetical protein
MQFFPFSGIQAYNFACQPKPMFHQEPGGVSSVMLSSLLALFLFALNLLRCCYLDAAVMLLALLVGIFCSFLVFNDNKDDPKKQSPKNIFLGV